MANEANKRKRSLREIVDSLEREKTQKSVLKTVGKTAYQVGIGVVGGSVLTAVLGKPSFYAGLGATLLGNFFDVPVLAPLGVGMMTAAVAAPKMDNTIKDRFNNLKDSFMSTTYMDKVFGTDNKSKETTGGSDGGRSTQNDEPGSTVGGVTEGEKTLREVEQQLMSSAMEFKNSRGETTAGFGGNETEEMDFSRF